MEVSECTEEDWNDDEAVDKAKGDDENHRLDEHLREVTLRQSMETQTRSMFTADLTHVRVYEEKTRNEENCRDATL